MCENHSCRHACLQNKQVHCGQKKHTGFSFLLDYICYRNSEKNKMMVLECDGCKERGEPWE